MKYGRVKRTAVAGWLLAGGIALLAPVGVSAAHADETACRALAGRTIPSAVSLLPTSGGVVETAEFVSAQGGMPAYCKAVGRLAPADPLSWPILFQVNLPEGWNGKAAQFGGAGTNGILVQATGGFRDAPPNSPGPLARGFVTFGTDGGHPILRPDPQVFALNSEAVINQAYASYKKTHDVALHLVGAYYGRAPRRMYFIGGSEGGREAMLAVQRYPGDYDGAIASVPAMNWVGQHLAHYEEWMLQQNGGWMSPAKFANVQKAVLAACDSLDGLADGVVSRYEGCQTAFDPASIRCPGGTDSAETCVSDRQLGLLRGIWSRKPFAFAVANGLASYPPSPFGGEAQPGGIIPSIVAAQAPREGDLGRPLAGPGSVRYYFAQDPEFKGAFDQKKYEPRIRLLSDLFDATNPDIRAFAARGGKFIIKENGSDFVRAPAATYEYYKAVVAQLGQPAVDSFLRFYVNPGVNHGGTGVQADGSAIPDKVDLFAALDDWVENGTAPQTLTVTSFTEATPSTGVASRPLCRYPLYPHYVVGDAKRASSFACRSTVGRR
jgi:feruloyl esterase